MSWFCCFTVRTPFFEPVPLTLTPNSAQELELGRVIQPLVDPVVAALFLVRYLLHRFPARVFAQQFLLRLFSLLFFLSNHNSTSFSARATR